MNNEEREQTIEEWCGKLPAPHAVNKQLKILNHCRNNPFKWAVWDFLRRNIPFIKWKSPNTQTQ